MSFQRVLPWLATALVAVLVICLIDWTTDTRPEPVGVESASPAAQPERVPRAPAPAEREPHPVEVAAPREMPIETPSSPPLADPDPYTDALVIRVLAAEAGTPIVGAQVSLRAYTELDRRHAKYPDMIGSTPDWNGSGTTDASGEVAFRSLARRNYEMSIRADGRRNVGPVRVGIQGLRVVDVPPGVALVGVVRDEDTGAAVPGVLVIAGGVSLGHWAFDEGVARGDTDTDGRFHLTGLPPGADVELEARADGYGVARLACRTGLPGGEVPDVDVALRGARSIQGVVRLDGRPAGGATVYATTTPLDEQLATFNQDPWPARGLRDPAAEAESSQDGNFELPELESGREYTLYAVGREPLSRGIVGGVKPGPDVVELALVPFPRALLHLTTADGKPVADRSVIYYLNGHGQYGSESDADGWSVVAPQTGIGESAVRATVQVEGFRTEVVWIHPPKTGDVRDTLTLTEGATISARVVDAQGQPVAGIELIARPAWSGASQGMPTYELRHLEVEGETDDDGRVEFPGLHERPYHVVMERRGSFDQTLLTTTPPWSGGDLTVDSAGSITLQFELPEGARKPDSVELLLRPSDEPAVTAWRARRLKWPASGSSTLDALPVGTLDIWLQVKGFAVLSRSVSVVSGEKPVVVPIRLEVGVPVRGRVTDATGRPIPGARISGVAQDRFRGWRDQPQLTDDEGGFTVHSVALGACQIRVLAQGFRTRTFEVDATAGAAPVVLTLQRGTRTTLVVRTAEGYLASDCELRVHAPAHPVDPDREFFVDRLGRGWAPMNLPPGDYVAEASHAEAGVGRAEFQVVAGRPSTVTVRLGGAPAKRR